MAIALTVKTPDPLAKVRHVAHQQLDQWLDQLQPLFDQEKPPIQDAEAMKADLKEIAARIPQEQVRVALLGDGAAWVWNTLVACFPEGKPVLDYDHCIEHVHKVAQAPSVRIIMETVQKPSNGLRRLWHDYPKTRWMRSSGDSNGFRPRERTRRKWTS